LAAFFAGPALLAAVDATPWRDFGRAFGALVQVLTDYFDLFLDPHSDDWEAAKPTVPLMHGRAHPTHGPAITRLMAKNRRSMKNLAKGRWHLVQAGAGARLEQVLQQMSARMKDAEERLGNPAALTAIRTEIAEWCGGVIDALAEYANDPAPRRWPF
jgi:geranylgeranyl pyrophosphate synthase